MPLLEQRCALCHSPASSQEDTAFCCAGCRAVYQILSAQGSLENFQSSPIYQEALRSGLITNPSLTEEQGKEIPEKGNSLLLTLDNLWCPSCARVIEWILQKRAGILLCRVDYAADLGKVWYDPQKISFDTILQEIRKLGYQAERFEEALQEPTGQTLGSRLRLWIAIFCSMNIMMFSLPTYLAGHLPFPENSLRLFGWIGAAFSLPIMGWCALPLFRRAFWGAYAQIWGMETLVAISGLTAWFFSLFSLFSEGKQLYFDSSSALITLTLCGNQLERHAKFSAKRTLAALAMALPRKARKRGQGGQFSYVPLKEVAVGDLLSVSVGEKVPVDGVVEESRGVCDESTWTGEAIPLMKGAGDPLYGGSLVIQGPLLLRVTKRPEEMKLQQLASLIARDLDRRPAQISGADRISQQFIPLLFFLALSCLLVVSLTSDPAEGIQRMFSILFIACPCALGIAAPLAEQRFIDQMAQKGVWVRNRNVLPLLGQESVMIFDKTGTLTEGTMEEVEGLEQLPAEDRPLLKGLVEHSSHPIARALRGKLRGESLPLEEIREEIGRGLRGCWKGSPLFLGSEAWMRELGFAAQSPAAGEGKVLLWWVRGGQNPKPLLWVDPLRKQAAEALRSLSPLPTLLLSGDQPERVQKAAEECGIGEWKACLSPWDKREEIRVRKERGECVAMIGDGVNDASALSLADISWTLHSAADMTQQVVDLFLHRSDLRLIAEVRRQAKKTQRIIRENFAWAFLYNGFGLFLAAIGCLVPLFAAAAMFLSSMAILLNTRRIN